MKPFTIKFEKFGIFDHKTSAVLYLLPEADPPEALAVLMEKVCKKDYILSFSLSLSLSLSLFFFA